MNSSILEGFIFLQNTGIIHFLLFLSPISEYDF